MGSSSDGPEAARPSGRPIVLLDTNILFLPVRVGFPLEAEIDRLLPGARVVVPVSSLRELDHLVARGALGAPAARALAARYEVVAASAEGDDGVVEVAVRERAHVVTADRELQARLRALGIPVLVPRDQHRLSPLGSVPVRRARPKSRRPATRRRGNR